LVVTLAEPARYLDRATGRATRVVVWARNSHFGDALATEMGEQGEWNVGQRDRECYDAAVVNLGFTTCGGTVTAACD
jgi:erythromycin esterase-like protein